MTDADLQQLEDELCRLGSAGFLRIRRKHPTESFYSFAFYTNGERNYVILTASTYEGLEQVARKYQQRDGYRERTLEGLKTDLKWSPCDSPLHEEAADELDDLQPLMDRVSAELDRRGDLNDDLKSYETLVEEIDNCLLNALQRIDADGVFGGTNERRNVLVNLLLGDQSDEERIRFARRLNSPAAVEAFIRDLTKTSWHSE